MTHEAPHILVVDDDDRLRALLKKYLDGEGLRVSAAPHAAAARELLDIFQFDAAVLDVMMPGETGLSLLAAEKHRLPPTLLLTAMAEVEDRITGLQTGAEDYLVKPFEPRELVLRLATMLRRAGERSAPRPVTFGDYAFDAATRQLSRGGAPVYLTEGEGELLAALAAAAGQAVSREDLAPRLGAAATPRAVDVQITRLRKKIEPTPGQPVYIQTVRHKGYVLQVGLGRKI